MPVAANAEETNALAPGNQEEREAKKSNTGDRLRGKTARGHGCDHLEALRTLGPAKPRIDLHPLLRDLISNDHSRHRELPIPDCNICLRQEKLIDKFELACTDSHSGTCLGEEELPSRTPYFDVYQIRIR